MTEDDECPEAYPMPFLLTSLGYTFNLILDKILFNSDEINQEDVDTESSEYQCCPCSCCRPNKINNSDNFIVNDNLLSTGNSTDE